MCNIRFFGRCWEEGRKPGLRSDGYYVDSEGRLCIRCCVTVGWKALSASG